MSVRVPVRHCHWPLLWYYRMCYSTSSECPIHIQIPLAPFCFLFLAARVTRREKRGEATRGKRREAHKHKERERGKRKRSEQQQAHYLANRVWDLFSGFVRLPAQKQTVVIAQVKALKWNVALSTATCNMAQTAVKVNGKEGTW